MLTARMYPDGVHIHNPFTSQSPTVYPLSVLDVSFGMEQ